MGNSLEYGNAPICNGNINTYKMSVQLIEVGSPAYKELVKEACITAINIGIEMGRDMERKSAEKADDREWIEFSDVKTITGIKTRSGLKPYLIEAGEPLKEAIAGKIRFHKHKMKRYIYRREDCEQFKKNKYATA